MNINSLNKRIDIYGNTEMKNELNEVDLRPGKIKTIWASIIPQTGRLQRQQAETKLSNVTHKVIVRFEAGKDITQDMFIKYGEHRFDIKFILDPYFKHETLELFCEEVIL